METITLALPMPEGLYLQWEQQPAQVRTTALELAIQAVRDYLMRQKGYEMLLQLPAEAEQFQDAPPADLADLHDTYLQRGVHGAA